VDHQSAVDRNLSERYILGELSPEEAVDFEEHFFDCPICSADIRHVSRLVANLKIELRDAIPTIELGPDDPFVLLTIRLETPTTSAVECDCRFGRMPPIIVVTSPQLGIIRLKFSAAAVSPGPCTVIIRDPRTQRERERHQFIIDSTSAE
jgi:hypothetical protein